MNNEDYIILESKLSHSEEEIELLAKGTASVLIKKLKNMAKNPNKAVRATFEQIARVLLLHDEIVDKNAFKPVGISYNRVQKRWQAEKSINGKKNYVASSKDKNQVVEALKQFCETHNIPM